MPKVVPLANTKQRMTGDIEVEHYPALKAVLKHRTPVGRYWAIKAAGVPLSAKRKIRRAVEYRADTSHRTGACRMKCLRCKSSVGEVWTKFQIWRHSFKKLEGMYGTGVLSFFVFLKSLFLLNILLTLVTVVFIILPQAINSGGYGALLTQLKASAATSTAGLCSEGYSANLTASVLAENGFAKFLGIIQGTGILENTVLFVGFYFPTYIGIGAISYNMPVAYLVVTGVLFFASFLFMLNRTGAAFKEAILQEAGTQGQQFSFLAFSSWDHALMDAGNVQLAKRVLRNSLVSELDLAELLRRRREGGLAGTCCRWLKRLLVNLLVLALLGGAGYLIYFVTTASADFAAATGTSGTFVEFLWQYLPAVVISLLAGLLPTVFSLLAKLEEYTPDVELLVTLARSILLRLASVAVLIGSIYSIVTCEQKDACRDGSGACTSLRCWESYVGQAFYKLEITFLLVALLVCFCVELPRSLIGRKCSCGLAKLIGPPEFDVPDSVLQVLYSQVIVWFGMFFCPFLPVMNTIVLFVFFYLRKFGCYFSYKPAERPFKSSKATSFFMITLFLAYFLCVLPLGFMITSLPTSAGCSPFRTNLTIYATITQLIATFSRGAQIFVNYLGSPGFLFFVIIVLLIVMHYFRTLAAARREISDLRRKKLVEQEQQKFSDSRRPTSASVTAAAQLAT